MNPVIQQWLDSPSVRDDEEVLKKHLQNIQARSVAEFLDGLQISCIYDFHNGDTTFADQGFLRTPFRVINCPPRTLEWGKYVLSGVLASAIPEGTENRDRLLGLLPLHILIRFYENKEREA